MSKIIELEIKNNNLTVDCFVEKEEYSLFKERVGCKVFIKGRRRSNKPNVTKSYKYSVFNEINS